ncbi:hypothetical protein DFH28DRAFT_1155452 [Melampsora americana]|nr:hypothetical protein DFH28DRAFT_1155452 [Melampsora americana]
MEYDTTQSSSSGSIELEKKERLTLADFLRNTGQSAATSNTTTTTNPTTTTLKNTNSTRLSQLSKLNTTLFPNIIRPSLPTKSQSNPKSITTNSILSHSTHPIQKLRHVGTASHPDLASLVRVARKRSKTLLTQPDSSSQFTSENPNPASSSFHYHPNLHSTSNLTSTTIAPRVTPLPKPKQASSSPNRANSPSWISQSDFDPYNQSPSGPGCRNSAPISTSSHPSAVSLQSTRLARVSIGSSRCYSIAYSDDPGTDHTSQTTYNSQLASLATESPYSPPCLSPSLDPPLSFTSGTGGTGLAGLVAAHKERRKAKGSTSSRSNNSDSDSLFRKSKSSSGQRSIYDFLKSTSHPSKRSTRSTASDTADESDEEGEHTAFQYFHRLLPTGSALDVNQTHEPSKSVVMERSASHAALNLNGQWAAWSGLDGTTTNDSLDQHSSFHSQLTSPSKSTKLNLRNRSISKPNPPTSSHPSRDDSQGDVQTNVSCLLHLDMIFQLVFQVADSSRDHVGIPCGFLTKSYLICHHHC